MRFTFFYLALAGWLIGWQPLLGQTFNTQPSRVFGHVRVQQATANPNLVEGREFGSPRALALDTSVSPPLLYVADAANNRVLGYRNAQSFENGAPADLVIGQRDRFSTEQLGPGTSLSSGLYYPTGLAVDVEGNLFVADTGNHRIVRYAKPFQQNAQGEGIVSANLVLGQPSLSSRTVNAGGLSARSLQLFSSSAQVQLASGTAGLAFDGQGNLWASDVANHRILRYNVQAVRGTVNGPEADVVLGQPNFVTNTALAANAANRVNKAAMNGPGGLAIDASGRLFATDRLSRVLVFNTAGGSSQAALRVMGIYVRAQGQPVLPDTNEFTLLVPQSVFTVANTPYVVDTAAHRILRFDPVDRWPAETQAQPSPAALAVFGAPALRDTNAVPAANRSQPEPGGNTLASPFAATVFGTEAYIADAGNNRVLAVPFTNGDISGTASRVLGQIGFDLNAVNFIEGRELFTFSGFRTGNLAESGGIAVDSYSNPPHLYIADTFNNRILGFRDARNVKAGDRADLVLGQPDLLRDVTNHPSGLAAQPNATGLSRPAAVAVDRSGNLYVADTQNGRVLRFARPFETQERRPNLVLGQADFTTRVTDATSRTMLVPSGLALTIEGHLVVSDAGFHRILYFRKPDGSDFTNGAPASNVIGQANFSSIATGSAANRLNSPHQLALDGDDRLYVADTANNRIAVFSNVNTLSPDANSAVQITIGQGTAALRTPHAVQVNQQNGDIWVSNTGLNQVLRYNPLDALSVSPSPTVALASAAPLSLALDSTGNPIISEATNRIAFYYPVLAATHGATFTTRYLAPGMIASLFPVSGTFGQETAQASALPLPTELGDLQVLVNGTPAPLLGVYNTGSSQINFIVPQSAPTSGTAEVQVVQRSTGQIIRSAVIPMNQAAPGLFTTNSQGTGQLAAIVVANNQPNSASNPVRRGEFITLYGTGQGIVANMPPDGQASQGITPTAGKPNVVIGTQLVPESDIDYSGLAPNFVGLWQINVRVPQGIQPGAATEVVVQWRDIASNLDDAGRRRSSTIVVQ